MKRVFICAPSGIGSEADLERDLEDHVLEAIRADVAPIAPALIYARFADEVTRESLLLSSLAWLAVCDEVWVYGPSDLDPSTRQLSEMTTATQLGIPLVSKLTARTQEEVPLFDHLRTTN